MATVYEENGSFNTNDHIHQWMLVRTYRATETFNLKEDVEVLDPNDDDSTPAKLTDLQDRDRRDVWVTTYGSADTDEYDEILNQYLVCNIINCEARIDGDNIQEVNYQ